MESNEINNIRSLLLAGIKDRKNGLLALELIQTQGLAEVMVTDLFMFGRIHLRKLIPETPIRQRFEEIAAAGHLKEMMDFDAVLVRNSPRKYEDWWRVYDDIAAHPLMDAKRVRFWAGTTMYDDGWPFFLQRATPEEFAEKFRDVVNLNFASQRLSIFPPGLQGLPHLKTLDLTGNRIAALPDWISEMKQLDELVLAGNLLKTLPDCLAEMPSLRIIDLNENRLKRILPVLTRIPRLQHLYLNRNGLRSVQNLHELSPDLVRLDLSQNYIQSIPKSIKSLKKLEWLDISDNYGARLHPEIGELTSLKALLLNHSGVSSLPMEIRELPLEQIELSQQLFHTLLPGQLPDSLRHLKVFGNGKYNPDWDAVLGHLHRLEVLDLSKCNVDLVPESLQDMENLEYLDLSYTGISHLPAWLPKMKKLTCVDLIDCPLIDSEKTEQILDEADIFSTFSEDGW